MSIMIDQVEALERRSINLGRMLGAARPAQPASASRRVGVPG
jgi:hypothetical protein